jgi:hypothetical protein
LRRAHGSAGESATRALFHYNINDLPEPQKAEFKRAYPTPAEYKLGDFKKEVHSWLFNNYAGDLDSSGKKALRIKANGNPSQLGHSTGRAV